MPPQVTLLGSLDGLVGELQQHQQDLRAWDAALRAWEARRREALRLAQEKHAREAESKARPGAGGAFKRLRARFVARQPKARTPHLLCTPLRK